MIYLDYAANTPIEKEVLDTYYQATMKYFANPNASHTLGLQAKEVIDQTTKHIAEQLHVLPEEIIYTSGASEANNLAIKGILERYKHRGKHVLISPLEHNSILSSLTKMQENGFIVEMIPLKEDGQVNVEKMKSMIQEDTILVSVCSVDSELGIRQPIEEIGEVLKDREKTIIELRFGLGGHKPKTQHEIADMMGISRSYVSRIETKAIGKLSNEFKED